MLFNLLYNLFTQLPEKRRICYKPWDWDSKNSIPRPGAKPYIPIKNNCDGGDKTIYISIP